VNEYFGKRHRLQEAEGTMCKRHDVWLGGDLLEEEQAHELKEQDEDT